MPVLVGGALGSVGDVVVGGSLVVGSGSSVLVGGGGVLVPVSVGSGGGAGGRPGTSGSGRSCAEDAVVSVGPDAPDVASDAADGEEAREEDASGGGCDGRDPGVVVDSTAELGCSVMSGPASSGRCDVATIAATAAKTVATPTPVVASSNRRFGRASGSCWSIAVLADSGGRSNTVATGRTGMIRRSAPVRSSTRAVAAVCRGSDGSGMMRT